MITDANLVNVSMVFYVVAFALCLFLMVSHRKSVNRLVYSIAIIGIIIQTSAFIMRWIQSYKLGYGHVPVTNRYESLVFFGWCLAVGWLIVSKWIKSPGIALGMLFSSAVMTAAAGLIPGSSPEVAPLMPALRSNWLLFHVVTCFLAYAAFAVATFVAFRILFPTQNETDNNVMSSIQWEGLMHRCVSAGFFLLTLGILSGSAWAQQSWGRYWGWDPKEVWSLITWIVYAIFLHARISRGWNGKKLALMAIAGFVAVLFTYLGVNILLEGLHSYA